MPAALVIALGIVLGLSAGGRVWNLRDLRLSWSWLVIPSYLVQALSRGRLPGFSEHNGAMSVVWVVSSIALAASLMIDLGGPGVFLIWAGTLANVVVFLVNGAMPVRIPEAFANLTSGTTALGDPGFYRAMNEATVAGWFGDILPASFAGRTLMLSVGDMLLLVGAMVAIVAAMTRHGDTPCDGDAPMCGVASTKHMEY